MTRNVATYDLLSQAVHAVSNKRAPYVQDPCTAMLPQQPDQRSPRLRCLYQNSPRMSGREITERPDRETEKKFDAEILRRARLSLGDPL